MNITFATNNAELSLMKKSAKEIQFGYSKKNRYLLNNPYKILNDITFSTGNNKIPEFLCQRDLYLWSNNAASIVF